ncbi:MAG: PHP domain-containing protein, partial [Candidatus Sumerlaeaceae bacterium]
KEHNAKLRGRAKQLRLKLNEYGLFREIDESGESRELPLPVETEHDVYKALGLQWIPPELREDCGEIEAAEHGKLPTLVELGNYRGTLHCHTTWSDGADSLEEMARAATLELKLEYIGICDHSQSATYARGLEIERLREQRAAIAELNRARGIRVLAGVECDIRPDGSLDYPDEVLEQLDVVVVSIHSHFQMTAEEMTERICRALKHPCADILGHVSGRLLLMREPYHFDLEQVVDTAARCKTIIEINGDPYRLDLDWRYCRSAKERGIAFAVNPDAHSRGGLKNILFGLNVARKGWLTAADVVNCLACEDLQKLLKERREHRRRLLMAK